MLLLSLLVGTVSAALLPPGTWSRNGMAYIGPGCGAWAGVQRNACFRLEPSGEYAVYASCRDVDPQCDTGQATTRVMKEAPFVHGCRVRYWEWECSSRVMFQCGDVWCADATHCSPHGTGCVCPEGAVVSDPYSTGCHDSQEAFERAAESIYGPPSLDDDVFYFSDNATLPEYGTTHPSPGARCDLWGPGHVAVVAVLGVVALLGLACAVAALLSKRRTHTITPCRATPLYTDMTSFSTRKGHPGDEP